MQVASSPALGMLKRSKIWILNITKAYWLLDNASWSFILTQGILIVGCNPTLREKRRLGCQPYTWICSAAKILQSNQIAVFQSPRACTMRKLHHNQSYYITYTSIHNYYITVQNKSGYRAGTRPSVFREGSGYTQLAYSYRVQSSLLHNSDYAEVEKVV